METAQLNALNTIENAESCKFLTFNLDKNNYGIPILKVNEIIGLTQITPMPKAPSYMKGVINLRGKIIPVVDLRLKFDMLERTYDANTCIIIINLKMENIVKQIGVVVDIVSEVCNIEPSNIEPSPSYGDNVDNSFISGIGKIKEKVIMLVDIEKVIFSEDFLHILKNTEEIK